MKKTCLLILVSGFLAVACDDVVVEAPDLSGLTDPGTPVPDVPATDPGPADVPAVDPGPSDPGVSDPGATDGINDDFEDPGADPGEDPGPADAGVDLNETPMPVGYTCITDQGCLSGDCRDKVCACAVQGDCEPGTFCDAGETVFADTGKCLPRRSLFAGCLHHAQCQSGACDKPGGLAPDGYCASCASQDGVGCGVNLMCCGGNCSEFCMGCAVSMELPDPVFCQSGCYDPRTQHCSPTGPAPKLPMFSDCQYSNAWCETGYCKMEPDGLSSWCACDGDEDCGGGFCIGGACAIE